MGWSSGTVIYGYTTKIDITDIVERIITELPGDNSDWYLDGENIVIKQSVETPYRAWNCKSTYESPAEHDIELDTTVSIDNIKDVVVGAFKETRNIFITLDVDDECDWLTMESNEPDPDRYYDKWKEVKSIIDKYKKSELSDASTPLIPMNFLTCDDITDIIDES